MKQRILSGVQPSGKIHLGNFFGALKPHIEASKTANPETKNQLYFIADLHALTSLNDRDELKQNVREVAATYVALGLDTDKAIFFRQSDIPEVCQLYWLLMSVCGMGQLERMHAYKDKIAKGLSANAALFSYPTLMAADILLYKSTEIPVGDDQDQHVQIARDLRNSFNAAYKTDCLVLPEAKISAVGRYPGIDGEKMSKSYGNSIPIFAEPKEILKLVKLIKTDSRPPEEPKNPDGVLVYQILDPFLTADERADIRGRLEQGKIGYGDLKGILAEKIDARFKEPRERFKELIANPTKLERILYLGAAKARKIAHDTLADALEAAGLDSAAQQIYDLYVKGE